MSMRSWRRLIGRTLRGMHFDILQVDKIHYHSSDQSEALLGGCTLVFRADSQPLGLSIRHEVFEKRPSLQHSQ
jgi:hypothetical protein